MPYTTLITVTQTPSGMSIQGDSKPVGDVTEAEYQTIMLLREVMQEALRATGCIGRETHVVIDRPAATS